MSDRINQILVYSRLFNMTDAQLASNILAQQNCSGFTPTTILDRYRNEEYCVVFLMLTNGKCVTAYKHHMGITIQQHPSCAEAYATTGCLNQNIKYACAVGGVKKSLQEVNNYIQQVGSMYTESDNSQKFALEVFNHCCL